MLASLAEVLPRVSTGSRSSHHAGWLRWNTTRAARLSAASFDSVESVLELPGEIISGHPERNVRRVVLPLPDGPLTAYLKCEHIVGWRTRLRNQRAGFGWVSRSQREQLLLEELALAGLPSPEWLAVGEDGRGRAVLLIAEAPGVELREALRIANAAQRTALARQLGQAIAKLHANGFSPRDLSAKHVFVHGSEIVLIDWQNAPRPGSLRRQDLIRQFATLDASLGEELLAPRDRLQLLRTYCLESGDVKLSELALAIRQTSDKLVNRSSIRDQRVSGQGVGSSLVWLAGESVCVVPELVERWPTPPDGTPFYRPQAPFRSEWVAHNDDLTGWLQRYEEFAPMGRILASLFCKSWRSRGATAGRILQHLKRNRVPAPRLLAFGQRLTSRWQAESFIYYEIDPRAVSLPIRLVDRRLTLEMRRGLLRQAGVALRALHDSQAYLTRQVDRKVFSVGHSLESRVIFSSPDVVRLQKQLTHTDRLVDLLWLNQHEWPNLSRADRRAVLAGYLAAGKLKDYAGLLQAAL